MALATAEYHAASLEVTKHSAPMPEQIDHEAAEGDEDEKSELQSLRDLLAEQAVQRNQDQQNLQALFIELQAANADPDSPERATKLSKIQEKINSLRPPCPQCNRKKILGKRAVGPDPEGEGSKTMINLTRKRRG